jgi:hypothetical protein
MVLLLIALLALVNQSWQHKVASIKLIAKIDLLKRENEQLIKDAGNSKLILAFKAPSLCSTCCCSASSAATTPTNSTSSPSPALSASSPSPVAVSSSGSYRSFSTYGSSNPGPSRFKPATARKEASIYNSAFGSSTAPGRKVSLYDVTLLDLCINRCNSVEATLDATIKSSLSGLNTLRNLVVDRLKITENDYDAAQTAGSSVIPPSPSVDSPIDSSNSSSSVFATNGFQSQDGIFLFKLSV